MDTSFAMLLVLGILLFTIGHSWPARYAIRSKAMNRTLLTIPVHLLHVIMLF